MKDSFIFEGKKYISAKRASDISDYSSDYIGQLCRAEKLDCRMIGRSWFITEESLHLHQANVLHDEIARNRIENLRGKKISQNNANNTSVTPAIASATASKSPAYKQIETVPVSTTTDLSAFIKEALKSSSTHSHFTGYTIAGQRFSPVSRSIKYLPDNRPLLPILNKGPMISPLTPDEVRIPIRKTSVPVISYPELTRSIILGRVLKGALVLVFVITLGYVAGGLVSMKSGSLATGISQTSGSLEASLYDVFGRITSGLRNGYEGFLSVFTRPATLTLNEPSNPVIDAGMVSVEDKGDQGGVAISPSTGSTDADEAVKEKIKNSFSDEVEVKPDQSGTAGIIKPVFRQSKGSDFIYVMVPLKDKEATPTAN